MDHMSSELVNVIVAIASFIIGLFTKKPGKKK